MFEGSLCGDMPVKKAIVDGRIFFMFTHSATVMSHPPIVAIRHTLISVNGH